MVYLPWLEANVHLRILRALLMQFCLKKHVLLWDDAPMVDRHHFEALDRTFRDIISVHGNNKSVLPFEEKVVVLGGDFRECSEYAL